MADDGYDVGRLMLLFQYKGVHGVLEGCRDRYGVTPLRLGRILRGVVPLDEDTARRVCVGEHVPLTFLVRRPRRHRDGRERLCVPRPDVCSVESQAVGEVELLDAFMDGLGSYMSGSLASNRASRALLTLSSMREDDMEALAAEARRLFRWKGDCSIVALIESCNVPVINLTAGGRYRDSDDLAYARVWDDGSYVALCPTDHGLSDAHRGQLAHMLAHLIMDGDCSRADMFAMAFLLPGEPVAESWHRDGEAHPFEVIEGLRHRYGVGFGMVVDRLLGLGLIDGAEAGRLRRNVGSWQLKREMDMPQGRWIRRSDGALTPDPSDRTNFRSAMLSMAENKPTLLGMLVTNAFGGTETGGIRWREAEDFTGLPRELLSAWSGLKTD